MDRVILHCDFNNFFASVECLYNPDIRNSPVAVCGSQSERRGIVLAKNYIAKKYGITTGEPAWQAKKKCPNLITVRPHYKLYDRFSKSAVAIYKEYTNQVEVFSIDECWLDITGSVKNINEGEILAYKIKDRIKDELGITISVGVSYNKMFAKLGSDIKKPDAVTIIKRDNYKEVLWKLPVEDMFYVGRKTAKKLNKVCIYTIGDLAGKSLNFMRDLLGKPGETLWVFANGYDSSSVYDFDYHSVVKGVGNSTTTPKDLVDNEEIKLIFYVLAESVGERLRRHNLKGRTVQISIRDNDLGYIERQGKLRNYTYINSEIALRAYGIFLNSWDWSKPVRALGVRVTDLAIADEYIQYSFLEDIDYKHEMLDHCVDKIRSRFGYYSIGRALLHTDKMLNRSPIVENISHRPISTFHT